MTAGNACADRHASRHSSHAPAHASESTGAQAPSRQGCTTPLAAEISLPELKALNHDINPDRLVEGQTILMPGGKLSDRDHDILAGIGPTTYRYAGRRKRVSMLADPLVAQPASGCGHDTQSGPMNCRCACLKLPCAALCAARLCMVYGSVLSTTFQALHAHWAGHAHIRHAQAAL